MVRTASITVVTSCRLELVLKPVPMGIMPSSRSEAWLAFARDIPFRYSYAISSKDVTRIADFMILHRTECLSDGNRNYTLYGRSLSACLPEAVEGKTDKIVR